MRCGAVTLLVLGTLSRAAHAESPEADRLFLEGRALLGENDAAGACAKFNAAVALDPTAPGIILNLGLCYERLGKYATSLVWFRRAQALAAEQQLPPDYKAAAEQYTVELAAKVALARIDVSGAPAGVEVKVDGRLVSSTDYSRIEVDSDSVVEATAAGYKPFRLQLTPVEGRDAGTIAIVLDPDMRGRRTKLIGVGLAGGGLLTVAGGFLYALHIRNRYEDRIDRFNADPEGYVDLDENGDPITLATRRDEADSDLKYKATTVVGIGLALIATGAIVYLTAPRTGEATATAFAPALGPDFAGFTATGRF